MVSVYEYPVRRPFTYDGKYYNAGELWTPQGLRNDPRIIEFFVNKDGARLKVNEAGEQVLKKPLPPRRGNV